MPDLKQLTFAEEFRKRALPDLRKSVVPLFAANPHALDQSGSIHVVQGPPIVDRGVATGTFFQKSGRHFLITAEHVLSIWNKAGYEIRVSVNNRPQPLTHFIEQTKQNADLDIAVVRLRPSLVRAFDECLFLGDKHVDMRDEIVDAHYLVAGHLAEGCGASEDRQTVRVAEYNLWTDKFTGNLSTSSFTSPDFGWLNVPNELWSPREEMQVHVPASLGGLSGSNVWRIFTDDELEQDWNITQIRVVGVQTSVFDKRAIRMTKWNHVMSLIDQLL